MCLNRSEPKMAHMLLMSTKCYQRKGNLIMTRNVLGLENVTEIKIIIICMRKLSSLSITAEIGSNKVIYIISKQGSLVTLVSTCFRNL